MQVNVGKEGSVSIVKPIGPIVSGELDDFEREMQRLIESWVQRIVIDLTETTFLDSAGLELLCRCQRQMGDNGLQLKLSNLNEMVQTILDLTRVSRRFQVYGDTGAAVRSFL